MIDESNTPNARDVAHHLHPFTNLKTHQDQGPLIIDRGEGVYLYDRQGRGYIDGMASLWCVALGYSESRLVEAAAKQKQRLPFSHTFRGRSHDPVIDLAEKLLALAPVPMSKVLFANSGSESNDTAVKLAWYYNNARGKPDKRKIIARKGGYHGTTIATASLSGMLELHRDFNLPIADIRFADCPHYYRYAEPGEFPQDFATRMADNLERLILDEDPETVAAFIAEPVMGVGAVIVPPPTYFEKIQAVLRKYDVVFIADEVVCGFGRTGNLFGSQTFDIRPDMLTVAKSLSSAYQPISALMVSDPIYQAMVNESEEFGVFGHGHTYSGHPVCAAVAKETLRIYEERDIVGHVRRVAPRLQDGLRALGERPFVGEVRGIGLMAAVELVADKETKAPFDPKLGVGPYLMTRAEAHGVFVRTVGDSVFFAPPLVITEEELEELLARFTLALADTEAAFAGGDVRSDM